MENENSSEIEKILDSLKSQLDGIRTELKDTLKTELASIRTEFKEEIDSIRTKELPSRPSPPEPPIPPGDFPETGMSDKNSVKKTEEYSLSDFTGIEVGSTFEVEIVRSDTYSISISAEDELFRNIDVSKEDDILKIRHSKHVGWRAQLTRPRAKITLPLLKDLRLSGITGATVNGFDSDEDFRLKLSGASSISGDMQVGNIELELSGACRARLTGSANDAVIKSTGAAHIDFRNYSVRNAAVKLSGASSTTIKMDGKLDAKLSGVSYLSWIGEPVMGNIRTSGGSRLNKE